MVPPHYKPKVSALFGPVLTSLRAKLKFIDFGKLGQLLYKQGHGESEQIRFAHAFNNTTGNRVMYDRKIKQWIPYDEEIVPWTYTLALEPRNKYDELEYFTRFGGLVKHKFIWTDELSDGLTTSQFEKLKSRTNHENHGRYTVTPHISTVRKNDGYGASSLFK